MEDMGATMDSLADLWARDQEFLLDVVGGRVFVDHAQPDSIDNSALELKCWWRRDLWAWADDLVRVGADKHYPLKVDSGGRLSEDTAAEQVSGWSLHDCPIIIKIIQAEGGWLKDNEKKPDDAPLIGRFSYSAPIQTRDGVVNEKRPTIFIWFVLGPSNFSLLRDQLIRGEQPNFALGVTVRFPPDAVLLSSTATKVSWDGNGRLPVVGARFVWKLHDWERDFDPEDAEIAEPDMDLSAEEDRAELLSAIKRLEPALLSLQTPVWLAAIAAAILVIAALAS